MGEGGNRCGQLDESSNVELHYINEYIEEKEVMITMVLYVIGV